MKTVIRANGLSKIFGKKESKFQALKDVSIDIKEGEVIAITGKSGSGKSTLMHLLACLDKPTSGSIEINGTDVSALNEKQIDKIRNESLGFVFQQFFMNPNESVLDNVALPLKIGGNSKKLRRSRALEALRAVELEDKAKNRSRDLSGGQKQRVCIARALVNNPSIIFADEPTGNLDSATGEKIVNLLFDLNKKTNITIVVVTHDEDLAKRCHRIINLRDGKIVSDKGARK